MSFDIVWTEAFGFWEKPRGYLRLLRARKKYGERLALRNPLSGKGLFRVVDGYQKKLARLRNIHEGRRCFIIGNGPSLASMDLWPLRNEITIGSNGIFRLFPKMGFHTTYLTMEDIAQCEDRRHEIGRVKGPIKIVGLHSAYCIPPDDDTLFMNVYLKQDDEQRFSEDCSVTTYLGSTVTFMNLQLAFHLGCDPVYLIGVDFNYGSIEKRMQPGRVIITEDIARQLAGSHFDPTYHKVGGRFGVPYVDKQYRAYGKAAEVFRENGRRIFNAGYDSALDVFEKVEYEDLFSPERFARPNSPEPNTSMDPNDELRVILSPEPRGEKWKKLYNKALRSYERGRTGAAARYLHKSLASKESIPACYLLARIAAKSGDIDEAARLFEAILNNPGPHPDGDLEAGAHFHLGEIYYQRTEIIEAQFHLENCLTSPSFGKRAFQLLERIRTGCELESFVGAGIETGAL